MTTKEIIKNRQLVSIMRQNHINFAALFGSRVKGSARDDSDYDFLIDYDRGVKFSLFDLVGLKEKLESELKAKVDLITVGGINRFMKDEILRTMKVIYDERKR